MKVSLLLLAVFLAVASSSKHSINVKKLPPNRGRKWLSLMQKVTPNPKYLPLIHIFPKQKPTPPMTRGTWKAAGCGVSSSVVNPRIVNGQEAVPHSYPWQVALYIDNKYFCGGSLISDEWILTAGHCTTGAKSIRAVLGAHNLDKFEASQQEFYSQKIITHADYGATLLRNDVGLVQISRVTFNDNIKTICLPSYSDNDLGAGIMLTASGWGKTKDGAGGISATLNEVTNPSITNNKCSQTYGSILITDATLCTDTSDGNKGTCNGDSGGPLMYDARGVKYSRGVTSFVSGSGCTSGDPDGFTRTLYYLDWIEGNTGIYIQ